MRLCAPFALALIAAGCADEAAPVSAPTTPAADGPAAVVDETPTTEIEWKECSLETGGKDGRAQCADVEVPLDWDAPEGRKVTFFVKRLLGAGAEPRQQLWLLQGGPGGAGDGLEGLAEEVAGRDDSVDIYIPDHRGTGRSAFLDCPETRKYVGFDPESCGAEATEIWGKEGFATFSTTTAARDVGHVIERTRGKDQKVHVYGVSYGTYWAQRYLQLFPDQASAVTLDSVCQAGLCSMSKIGYWFDQVGKKYLGECAADAVCASKLGPDPVATVREAMAKADAGTCAGIAGMRGSTLRELYSWFIASFELRVLIPSTAFRIVRCNEDDVAALSTFMDVLSQMFGGGGGGGGTSAFATKELSSDVLGLHIALSELEQSPAPTASELSELMADALFADVEQSLQLLEMSKNWPRYAHDAFVGKYPDASSTPVLLMNGTLDPQTPQEFADAVAPHYTKPNQTYVLLPRAAHGTIHQSPTGAPPAEACGTTLWKQFVAAPTAPLDTSCTQRISKHDFESSPAIAQYFFGRPTLFSAASFASAPNAPPPLTPLETRSLQAELRRAERATRLLTLPRRLHR